MSVTDLFVNLLFLAVGVRFMGTEKRTFRTDSLQTLDTYNFQFLFVESADVLRFLFDDLSGGPLKGKTGGFGSWGLRSHHWSLWCLHLFQDFDEGAIFRILFSCCFLGIFLSKNTLDTNFAHLPAIIDRTQKWTVLDHSKHLADALGRQGAAALGQQPGHSIACQSVVDLRYLAG